MPAMAERREKSPFPGMDPYLERHWTSLHSALANELAGELNAVLPPDLAAEAEEFKLVVSQAEPAARRYPDVSVRGPDGSAGVAVRERRTVDADIVFELADEPATHHEVRVVEVDGGRLITAVEFLSPENKRGRGRTRYLRKRDDLLDASVAVVEVDLTRRGQWRALLRPYRVPAEADAPYRITTHLPERPGQVFCRSIRLRAPLPEVEIPLRPGDPRAAVALQPLLDLIYRKQRFGHRVDYAGPPDPPLTAEDAAWAAERLRAAGAA